MEFFIRAFDIRGLILFILIGIFSLLLDSSSLKEENATKELKILQIISYSYIVFGIIMLVVIKKN